MLCRLAVYGVCFAFKAPVSRLVTSLGLLGDLAVACRSLVLCHVVWVCTTGLRLTHSGVYFSSVRPVPRFWRVGSMVDGWLMVPWVGGSGASGNGR